VQAEVGASDSQSLALQEALVKKKKKKKRLPVPVLCLWQLLALRGVHDHPYDRASVGQSKFLCCDPLYSDRAPCGRPTVKKYPIVLRQVQLLFQALPTLKNSCSAVVCSCCCMHGTQPCTVPSPSSSCSSSSLVYWASL